jgi:hypothetical protein
MNKRNFVLGSCTTLAGGLAVAAAAPGQQPALSQSHRRLQRLPDLQERAGLAEWRNYIGERFEQASFSGTGDVVLLQVAAHQADTQAQQFTLVFASVPDATPGGATRQLRHGNTGQRLSLFLQPAGQDSNGRSLLRADFNCLA